MAARSKLPYSLACSGNAHSATRVRLKRKRPGRAQEEEDQNAADHGHQWNRDMACLEADYLRKSKADLATGPLSFQLVYDAKTVPGTLDTPALVPETMSSPSTTVRKTETKKPVSRKMVWGSLLQVNQPAKVPIPSNRYLLAYQHYGPRTLADFIGATKLTELLHQWLDNYGRRQGTLPQESFLLQGPCGSGKSHIARLYFLSRGYHVVEYNFLNKFALRTELVKHTKIDMMGKRIAVVIDDLYELVEDWQELTSLKCHVPVICTSTRAPKRKTANNAPFAHVYYNRELTPNQATVVIQNTLDRLPPACRSLRRGKETMKDIIEQSLGDARKLIANTVTGALNSSLVHTRDETPHPFHQIRNILRGKRIAHLESFTTLLLHENVDMICSSVGKIEACAEILESLAHSDALQTMDDSLPVLNILGDQILQLRVRDAMQGHFPAFDIKLRNTQLLQNQHKREDTMGKLFEMRMEHIGASHRVLHLAQDRIRKSW